MAKALDRPRPKSTIADMIDGDLIDQATGTTPPEAAPPEVEPPESPEPPEEAEVEVTPSAEQGLDARDRPSSLPAQPAGPVPGVLEGQGGLPQRTGEHSDIQKMYRLTPTATRTVQQLSMVLGGSLGFDVNNSVVVRSVLRVVHQALTEIEASVTERVTPRKQPSTAIGNEHLRDALEQEIADAIRAGIQRYAVDNAGQ